MNKVIITGRISNDVVKQTSASGKEYVRFSVAVERFMKDKDKKTIFVDCMAFAHNANFIAKYCKKGSKVIIDGELDSNTIEKDGGKRTYWTVIVSSVEADKPKEETTMTNTALPFET